jgi:hypothetical protein
MMLQASYIFCWIFFFLSEYDLVKIKFPSNDAPPAFATTIIIGVRYSTNSTFTCYVWLVKRARGARRERDKISRGDSWFQTVGFIRANQSTTTLHDRDLSGVFLFPPPARRAARLRGYFFLFLSLHRSHSLISLPSAAV